MFLSDSFISFTVLWRQMRNGKFSTFVVSESNHSDGCDASEPLPLGSKLAFWVTATMHICILAFLFALPALYKIHSHIRGLEICLILLIFLSSERNPPRMQSYMVHLASVWLLIKQCFFFVCFLFFFEWWPFSLDVHIHTLLGGIWGQNNTMQPILSIPVLWLL